MSISGIYSLSNEVVNSTESKLSTSYVDIDIKEYRNGALYTEDNEIVMPGEDIALNPRIDNLGIDCYIRAKITYIIDGKEYDEFEYIDGNYKEWNKSDGYYYYDNVLAEDGEVSLFDYIHVPDNLTSEYQGKKIIVNILVEAIQAKNFNNNWNVDIKEAVERSYSIDPSGGSEVIYENNAQEYLNLGDGFFDNLGGLLPGDNISDKVIIDNSSTSKIKYYLSVNTEDLTQEEKNLLDNIKIVIRNKSGEVLKNGSLADINKLVLGTYNSGDKDEINFEIELPVKLDNDYSKLMTKIIWVFSLEVESTQENPNTWDLKFDLSIIVFLLSALGLIIVMILEKKENDNIEKNS